MSEKPISQSTPTPETKKTGTVKPNQLAALVQTVQFAWFIGHVVTLISIFFYLLTYIKIGARFYKFWYNLAFIGVVESFGILIFQLVTKKGGKFLDILKDDNAHYLWLGANMILLRPYVLLTTIPFALYSLFHVLAYSKGYLFPALGLDKHPYAKQIGSFISENDTKSIQLASLFEIYTFVWLLLRVLTFRKRSLTPFLIYLIFIKFRYEKSIFTRNYFKSLELQVEDLVNKTNVPAIKQAWIQIKQVFKKIGGFYLVNNFTKEKLT